MITNPYACVSRRSQLKVVTRYEHIHPVHEAWRQIASLGISDISSEFHEENLGASDSSLAFDVCNFPVSLAIRVYFKVTLFVSMMKVKCYIRGIPVTCSDKTERRVTLISAQADNRYAQYKWIHEISYIWTAEKIWRHDWSGIAVIHTTSAVVKFKPKKTIQAWTNSNPWPVRYRYGALVIFTAVTHTLSSCEMSRLLKFCAQLRRPISSRLGVCTWYSDETPSLVYNVLLESVQTVKQLLIYIVVLSDCLVDCQWLINWLIFYCTRKSKRELQPIRELHKSGFNNGFKVFDSRIALFSNPSNLALTISDNTVAENCRRRIVAAKLECPHTVPPHLPTKASQVIIFATSVASPNQRK